MLHVIVMTDTIYNTKHHVYVVSPFKIIIVELKRSFWMNENSKLTQQCYSD